MTRMLDRTPRLATVQPLRRQRLLAVVHPHRVRASLCAYARARQIARERDADLHVLCVLPRRPGDGRAPLARLIPLVGDRLVRIGATTAIATEVAREIGADLIIAGAELGKGGHWARVARRTRIPVLVARPARTAGALLAATDFTDPRFPTLRSAVRLASRGLDRARVLLLHNVDPRGIAFTRGLGVVLASGAVRTLRDARAKKLHAVVERAPLAADAVLSASDDPVTAIAEHAARIDADVVVVGAHAASPRARGPYRRTANRVIERIGRSALVLPLGPRGLG